MKKSIDIIMSNFPIIDKMADDIAKVESQTIAKSFSSIFEYSSEKFKSKIIDCEERIIKKVFKVDTLIEIYPKVTIEEINSMKFNYRQISAPLLIPYAHPLKQMQWFAMPILSLSGVVIGMLSFGFLFRVLLGNDYRQFAFLVGAPVGSILFSLAGVYLYKREVLIRILQGFLGVATAVEVFSIFTGVSNPISLLWGKLTNRFGNRFFDKIKRIGAFVLGILILQLVIPEEKLPLKQIKENSYEAIKLWLNQSLKLLILTDDEIDSYTEKTNDYKSVKNDNQILLSIVKLTKAQSAEDAKFIGEEVIQSFKNAGYEIRSKEAEKHQVFYECFKKEFDIEGCINEKDKYKIRELPIYKNDGLVFKGKLTKRR